MSFPVAACRGKINNAGIKLTYLISDTFITSRSAGAVNGTAAEPGPGTRNVTDTGNVLFVANTELVVGTPSGDTDPVLYWTAGGSGFTRASGRSLILYYRNTVWGGWSNSSTPSASALLYGAKGRSVYSAGNEYTDALPTGDPVHIIALSATGAQHICRYGTDEYLCWVYPTGTDATLWPVLFGDACNVESAYIYDTSPVSARDSVSAPAQGGTFTHGIGGVLIEFDVATLSTSADTVIVFREQDSQNRIELYLSAGRRLSLYKRVSNSLTLVQHLTSAGAVTNGSRIVMQFIETIPTIFQTSGGLSKLKSWCNTTTGGTATDLPFDDSTTGKFLTIPAGTSLMNFRCWGMQL